MTAEELAQGQLEAYNARSIDRFCTYFAEDVVVVDGHSGEIMFQGMSEFRPRYAERFAEEGLHCRLLSRMVHENIVIDHESVEGLSEEGIVEAIAIYEIHNEKIATVRFY